MTSASGDPAGSPLWRPRLRLAGPFRRARYAQERGLFGSGSLGIPTCGAWNGLHDWAVEPLGKATVTASPTDTRGQCSARRPYAHVRPCAIGASLNLIYSHRKIIA